MLFVHLILVVTYQCSCHYGDGRTGQHRTSTVSDRTMDTLWAHMSDALALTRHRVCQRGYRVLLR